MHVHMDMLSRLAFGTVGKITLQVQQVTGKIIQTSRVGDNGVGMLITDQASQPLPSASRAVLMTLVLVGFWPSNVLNNQACGLLHRVHASAVSCFCCWYGVTLHNSHRQVHTYTQSQCTLAKMATTPA